MIAYWRQTVQNRKIYKALGHFWFQFLWRFRSACFCSFAFSSLVLIVLCRFYRDYYARYFVSVSFWLYTPKQTKPMGAHWIHGRIQRPRATFSEHYSYGSNINFRNFQGDSYHATTKALCKFRNCWSSLAPTRPIPTKNDTHATGTTFSEHPHSIF